MILNKQDTALIGKYSNLSTTENLKFIKSGLQGNVFPKLQEVLSTTRKFLIDNLEFKQKTLDKHIKTRLTETQSEKTLRIFNVVNKSIAVFEDDEHAINWLTQNHEMFDNKPPISLCATGFGYSELMNVLGQIEHGITA